MTEKKEMTLEERLTLAQNELKAPKNQYNSFGKYKYRSAEDILESVKPINKKYGLNLCIKDEIFYIGERYYVQAKLTLSDYFGNTKETTGLAREEETKKGMDGSQITGTASSYARKYALNGMYLIDDTKDADTDEYAATVNQTKKTKQGPKKTDENEEQLKVIKNAYKYCLEQLQWSSEFYVEKMAEFIGVKIEDMKNTTTLQKYEATKKLKKYIASNKEKDTSDGLLERYKQEVSQHEIIEENTINIK